MDALNTFSDKAISVTELNATIKACLDSAIFKGLEVFGEVSGFKVSGAHAYFTLKDENTQLSCVCFNVSRTYKPKDGESVVLRGSVDYWLKGGRLSFQATLITPIGQGLLFLQFERLRAKLTAEGLFDEARKKPLPAYPKTVAVITSRTGAVIRDIVTTVRRKNPVVDIIVRDVRVQGAGAAHEIATALKRVDALGFDVIVIARGGGSLEDLAAFYDEELVRAVYGAVTPIVSAVGHETDFSLIDFAADKRAATPTAAAELVAYDYYALSEKVSVAAKRLSSNATRAFGRAVMRTRLAGRALGQAAQAFYSERRRRTGLAAERLGKSATAVFDRAENRLDKATAMLDGLSPLKVLRRGYFRIESEFGGISSVRRLSVGDAVTAVGGDGAFKAEVTDIIPSKGDSENE